MMQLFRTPVLASIAAVLAVVVELGECGRPTTLKQLLALHALSTTRATQFIFITDYVWIESACSSAVLRVDIHSVS